MWAPFPFSLLHFPLLIHPPLPNSIPNTMHHCGGAAHEMADPSSSPSSSAVDCTLSLGTPSTRSSHCDSDQRAAASPHLRRSAGSYVSNFCWDLLHSKHKSSAGRCAAAVSSGCDPLVARRCANCDTTSTPLWRNGPRGPKSLCNACGIRFKKEERRAAAVVNITAAESNGVGSYTNSTTTTWVPHNATLTTQKLPYLSPPAVNSETENGMSPFLSWRLNVTDYRPGLVHDFTR